jgi:hypothetical protein
MLFEHIVVFWFSFTGSPSCGNGSCAGPGEYSLLSRLTDASLTLSVMLPATQTWQAGAMMAMDDTWLVHHACSSTNMP